MGTAFEEYLNSGGTKKSPDYISAADSMNIANGNDSFLDSAFDVIESIPKFIGVSLISGANQLYNIAPDVGNFFGGDYERLDTSKVIADLDSDYSKFYEDNKEGADLVGFIASSLVPGLGGVKMLKAGQASLQGALGAGRFGGNMGKALGLLVDSKQVLLDKAVKEVATNGSSFSILSGNALKAVGQGAKQNLLEAVAFETAVAVTMFNSPILENQDMGDLVSNIAFSAGVFGLLGTAIDATVINSTLKAASKASNTEARPWTFIYESAKASDPYERAVMDLEQIANIPALPKNLTPERLEFLKQASKSKTEKLNNRVRKTMAEITGGDEELASTLFAAVKGTKPQDQTANLFGLADAGRLVGASKFEKKINTLATKIANNKASAAEIAEYNKVDLATAYTKMWGERAGDVLTEAPVVTSVIDLLKKGESLKVTAKGVVAGAKKFNFSTTYNMGKKAGLPKNSWNIMKASALESDARYIWAQKLETFKPDATKRLTVDINDFPLMEKVLDEVDEVGMQFVRFTENGKTTQIDGDFFTFMATKKIEMANKLLVKEAAKGEKGLIQDQIAAILNVKSSALSGELVKGPVGQLTRKDFMAMQDHADTFTKSLLDKGLRKPEDGLVEIWNVPQHSKMTYNTKPFDGIDNFIVEGTTVIKEQQKLYQAATARASADVLGDDIYRLLEDIDSGRVFSGAYSTGAGASFLGAASNNYGTLAASVENIGRTTFRAINKFKERSSATLEPLLYSLGNNRAAAIEFSVLNNRLRATPVEYALNAAGDALEPIATVRWTAMAKEAEELGEAIPKKPVIQDLLAEDAIIGIENADTLALMKAHIEINSARTHGLAKIRSAQGVRFNREPDIFYPIPANPRDYPNFAIVIDESVTGAGRSKTLFADNADDLDRMIRKMKENDHMRVLTKREAEDYYKSIGQFDYEKSISKNHIDTEAARKGTSAPLLPSTDPKKIVEDVLSWHMERESNLVREAVSSKYEVQFEELRRLGDDYTDVATSKFDRSSFSEYAEDSVKNPFADYVKTALNVSKQSDYPVWVNVNRFADDAISNMYKKIDSVFSKAKSANELGEIDAIMRKAGYKGAAYDADMDIFANAGASKGALSNVVQKANGIMATVVLRWDTLNAVNNAVSANVLLGAETAAVVRAISRGDADAVGALAKLMKSKVPGSTESITTPQRMIGEAVKRFGTKTPEMQWFKDNGYVTGIHEQYLSTLDNITYRGKETITSWDNRLNKFVEGARKAGNAGEVITGNRLAEEFNRFVAADVMKQMTDVAVVRKLMTEQEQLAYINTFVNRTQGNYLAAQRPMMFQGPVGQAIGLFQTYQFNLLQQMLRHIGEGPKKDALTLMGLQGTIHGMNGLPGFDAVNTNIIGNASGNQNHKDIYDATYGTVGKEAGDWLMYGVASNALGLIDPDLKTNLYVRGDLNPRTLTLVPNSPAEIPIIQATAKVIGNMIETAKKSGIEGADISTVLLQGLEHNGISRPLAGIAQVLQGLNNPEQASYSTSKRGNVIGANDFLSLTNLGRVLGGKPMDEAVAIDATYRYKAYALKDSKRRQLLGEAIKSSMIAGQEPSSSDIDSFITSYVAGGGRQKEFNQWFGQLYKTANLSQANKIQQDLNGPFSQSMQRLMGGEELRDFTE
jgi:hypothetical protein